MGTGTVLRAGRARFVFFCLVILMLLSGLPAWGSDAATSMQAYCSLPPLPGLGVKPNLLLLLDNSASMYDLAYSDPANFCVDDTFDPSHSYYGYFDRGTFYRYLAASDSFAPASVSGTAGSACSQVQTAQLCVNVSAGKVDNLLASGNFLNWLTMSKLDLEKFALTGGRYDMATNLLQPESRGCQGRRFVKMVKEAGQVLPVTFAVRGPIPSESGYVSQGNHGGATRIEVYATTYNKDVCLSAVSNWQQKGKAAELTSDVVKCMGGSLADQDGTPSTAKVYSETMGYCYNYLAGTDITYAGIVNTLLYDCYLRYKARYNETPANIVKNTGDDVCAQGLYHPPVASGGYSTGYLGQCYVGPSFRQQCSVDQTKDFCANIEKPWLSDPTTSINQIGTNASLPGFILDAGITGLGKPGLTAQARFAATATPSGLIQAFSDDVNFGAMIFNDDGTGTECGGAIPCLSHCSDTNLPLMHKECSQNKDCDPSGKVLCVADGRNDGGRIISYINSSPVGDHTAGSGLISAIDAIRATSWTPLAESFYEAIGYFANLSSFRLQSADFDTSLAPSKYSCQRNSVVILSDGASSADRAQAMNSFVAAAVGKWVNGTDGMPASQTTVNGAAATAAPENQGSYNLDDLAWIAKNKNIFDASSPITKPNQYITTHVVYTGPSCGQYRTDGSCVTTDEGVPEKMMQLTAAKGGGSITSVQDPSGLQNALKTVFMQVRGGSNAGSGSSILATGEGNGALFLQPQFYPNKSFDGGRTSAAWIGELQGLWYYIDSFVGGSSGAASGIREDTGAYKKLDLMQDRGVEFVFDTSLQEARARLSVDADGDGSIDAVQPTGYPRTVVPEAVQSLWRAGRELWVREATGRTIYTQTGGASLVPLLDTTLAANRQLLLAADKAEADQVVDFVKGKDDSASTTSPTRDRSVVPYGATDAKVWKLGDIISSTPVLQSAVPLGSYHLLSPRGYGDVSYAKFIDATGPYAKRGTVYAGANDGMLHAFRLGKVKVRPEENETWPLTQKAALEGSELGREEWGFVPKNALPYLRYLKEPLYRHLYYVDGAVTVVDASIGDPERCSRDDYWNCAKDAVAGSNWRSILIGGMGLGGASRPSDATCVDKDGSVTCVKAPAGSSGGLSSYFALDVTGQAADGSGSGPRFLWEFSHTNLGFATSGAAIMHVKARSGSGVDQSLDPSKNGRWFAVFASGPTGAVDARTRQFTAVSDQNLKLFVVDLNAVPPLTQGRNYWVIDTEIPKAFGGSMAGAGIDADKWNSSGSGNYQDEALYLGYTRVADGGGWTGGVLRLLTNEDPDPSTWKTSKVIDDIGPVTGAVGKLQDRQYNRLWLYFGAGRYFNSQDDLSAGRTLYGVIEPCYGTVNANILKDNGSCTKTQVSRSNLTDVTDSANVVAVQDQGASYKGWRIDLDAAGGGLGSERAIDGPISLTGGAVFFTTYKPPLDPCQDGYSYLWGVHYSTGGPTTSLSAQAVLPLSNGSTATLDAGGFADRGKRRSPPQPGKALKPRLVTNSGLQPVKKIIHIQER